MNTSFDEMKRSPCKGFLKIKLEDIHIHARDKAYKKHITYERKDGKL